MIVDCGTGLVLKQAVFLQPPFTSNPHDKVEAGQRVPKDWTPVPGMTVKLDVDSPGLIEVGGHIGFQIEAAPGERAETDDKFMLGIALQLNGRSVREPMGTQATANEVRDTHYHDAAFFWAVPIELGTHVVEVMARAQPKRGADDCLVYLKERHYHGAIVKVFGS